MPGEYHKGITMQEDAGALGYQAQKEKTRLFRFGCLSNIAFALLFIVSGYGLRFLPEHQNFFIDGETIGLIGLIVPNLYWYIKNRQLNNRIKQANQMESNGLNQVKKAFYKK